MVTVEQLLGNLLLRHNCVIVPSFGGFVAKQVSAKIDFESGKMFPPSKSLLFNKQLINNDGLLISELAQANKWSYEQASATVEMKISDWHHALHLGQRIELDRIGYLFFDAEKNLCFEQDRFFNLLLESFGLGQVHFLTESDVKIVERTLVQLEEKVNEPEAQKPAVEEVMIKPLFVAPAEKTEASAEEMVIAAPAKTERSKAWRYVAAACILPIAFYSLWIPMKTDVLESGVISLSDFNPFHSRTEGSYEQLELETVEELNTAETQDLATQIESLPEEVDAYTYQFDEALNISVAVPEKTVEEAVEVLNDLPSDNAIEANAMHYIVGCFSNESNATNLVAKLKAEGLDGRIVDVHNGLHRVSAGGAISLEAFAQLKANAKSMGYSGWTLK